MMTDDGADPGSSSPHNSSAYSNLNRRQGAGDLLRKFCQTLNIIAGIAALLCLLAHAMALSLGRGDTAEQQISASQQATLQVLRLYGIAMAALMVLVETESEVILVWLRAAENWVGRAVLQAFLGMLTLELARSQGGTDFHQSLGVYRQVAAWTMISCACVYLLGGLMCLGVIKKSRDKRAAERSRVERELEALETQRQELRIMLANYPKA